MIDEVIIMDQQGEIIFYNNYVDVKCDATLLTNLLMAIQQFGKTVFRSDLKEIGLKDRRYVFIKDEDISLAVSTSNQQVTEQMKEIINSIKNRFVEKFGSLKDFSGDISIFSGFEDDLAEILPNEKPKISSQDLLKQLFGIKINSKRILEEL